MQSAKITRVLRAGSCCNSHWQSSEIYLCNSLLLRDDPSRLLSRWKKNTARRPATAGIWLWKWVGGGRSKAPGGRWGRREERPGARCNKKQLTCPLKILNFLTACDHILCRAWAVFIVAGYNLLGDAVHPGLFICFYHSTRLCNSNTIVAYILKQILLPVSHRNTSKTQQGNLLGVSLTLTLRGPGNTQDHILMFKNNKSHYYFKCQEQIDM